MVTREQAMTAREFHYGTCVKVIGSRGGERFQSENWRRNGQTQTWKTRPAEFTVPIKFGLYGYSYLTHNNADEFHLASECQPEIRTVRPAGATSKERREP